MKVIVITYRKFPANRGGVSKHASHLKIAFPEAVHYSWNDLPEDRLCQASISFEPEKAKALNSYLLSEGLVRKGDVVIADGFWFHGLEGSGCRIVSVIHGTFAGWLGAGHSLARAQAEIIPLADEWVAVSPFAESEAERFYGVKANEVILNAVDLERFKPDGSIEKIYDFVDMAGTYEKGFDVVTELRGEFKGFTIWGMGEEGVINSLRRGKVFLSPSRYEGNSYGILEAISCGLPVLGSPVGLLWDSKSWYELELPGIAWPVHRGVQGYRENLNAMLKGSGCHSSIWESPRKWAEDHLSLDRFTKEWKNFIDLNR